jgi:DUF4097 and DUF4098 domain-containing protein YvlB
MRRMFLSLLFLAPFVSVASAADNCKFTAQRDFDVDAAGLKTLALQIGSTDVHVEGVAGLAKVEVRGRACASQQDWLDQLTVEQQRSGDRLVVTPHEEHSGNHWNLGGSSYAWIDLRVRVPAKLAVDIHAASGDADVRDVAALDFKSASGDLRVENVAGAFGAEVASGDIEGKDIGSLDLRRTASGDIRLRNVHGDARVGNVGSGDITLEHVDGGVEIGNVGSGDLRVSHVARDLRIASIGSGDMSVDDIGGDFVVKNRGSGDLHQHDVRGRVDVPKDEEED